MVMASVMDRLVDAMLEEIRQAQQQNSIKPFHLLRSHCLIRPGTDDILGDRILSKICNAHRQQTLPPLAQRIKLWVRLSQDETLSSLGYLTVNLTLLLTLIQGGRLS